MPKSGIHPPYHLQAKVVCSCGAVYMLGATQDNIKVDICRQCHPFYSGTQKFIDTAGRVDRFRERMAKTTQRAVKGRAGARKTPTGTSAAVKSRDKT